MRTPYISKVTIVNADSIKVFEIGHDRNTEKLVDENPDQFTIGAIVEVQSDKGPIYRIYNTNSEIIGVIFPGVPVYIEISFINNNL